MSMTRGALAAFLTTNAISVAGTRISGIAIPGFVLTTTGSAAKTGVVAVCELTPLVLAMALGGPIIDRVGARRISIRADVASTVLVALIPLLHAAGRLSFPALLVLVALAGATRGPGDSAKATLAPDIAEAVGLPIERVTGLESTAQRGAQIVAPALAGLVIAALGGANALYLDAASFAICAVGVAVWAPRRRVATEAEAGPYREQLRSGWRFLSGEPLLRAIVGMICLTNLIDIAYSTVLLPVWIKAHGYGPAQLGLLGSAFGLTATAGALLAAAFGDRLPRRATYLIGFAITTPPRLLAMAAGAPIWVVVGISIGGGFGAGFINPIIGAIMVERTPRAMLGRVNSLAASLSWAGMPLGGAAASLAIAAVGLAPALAVAGGIYLLSTTLPGLLPQWRDMNRRASRRAEPRAAGHVERLAGDPPGRVGGDERHHVGDLVRVADPAEG
jgi:MFS family permease